MSTVTQQLASLLLFWTCPHRIRGRVGVVSSFGVSLPYLVASVPVLGCAYRCWSDIRSGELPLLLHLCVHRARPLRYGRRPGQPWSSALARRVCVHSPTSSCFLSSSTSSRTSRSTKRPLAPIVGQRGDGDVGASPCSACERYVRCALPVCSLCLIMFSFPQCRFDN